MMGDLHGNGRGLDAPNREDSGAYRASTSAASTSGPARASNKGPAVVVRGGQAARMGKPVARADRLLGDTLGDRYRIEKRLARGAMGCVYIARQTNLDRTVAIKVLDPKSEAEAPDTLRTRFLREAGTLARLQHPNTVRVYDYGTHRGLPYLVMEHVDGSSLRRLASAGPVPPGRMLRILDQISDALREAHALGLIHRDLKPANVLLTRHAGSLDVVKVVDFGLAKDFQGSTELTQAGQVLGTPMYMAPEQIRDEACDQRTDIYALGVLAYRGLTGETPFDKAKAMQVLVNHLKKDPPTFAEANPALSLPPVFEQTVMTCMAKDPNRRFANVAELQRALALCQLALDHDEAWAVGFDLVDGRVVLPERVSESETGGYVWSATPVPVAVPTSQAPAAAPAQLAVAGGIGLALGTLLGAAVAVSML